jgi:hypothetical protein
MESCALLLTFEILLEARLWRRAGGIGTRRPPVVKDHALQGTMDPESAPGLRRCEKTPAPVILSEAKNLRLFVLREINADSLLHSE